MKISQRIPNQTSRGRPKKLRVLFVSWKRSGRRYGIRMAFKPGKIQVRPANRIPKKVVLASEKPKKVSKKNTAPSKIARTITRSGALVRSFTTVNHSGTWRASDQASTTRHRKMAETRQSKTVRTA